MTTTACNEIYLNHMFTKNPKLQSLSVGLFVCTSPSLSLPLRPSGYTPPPHPNSISFTHSPIHFRLSNVHNFYDAYHRHIMMYMAVMCELQIL